MKFRPQIGPKPKREGFVEEQINESIARGEFENLKGKGKPLPPPPDLAKLEVMRQKLRSDADFGAPWTSVSQEIEAQKQKIEREVRVALEFREAGFASTRSNPVRIEADFRARLNEIEKLIEGANSLVLKNNVLVPRELPHLYRRRFKIEDFLPSDLA